MTIFLATACNGPAGQLISIALVSDDGCDDSEFYAVRALSEKPTRFAIERVLANLGRSPMSDPALQQHLFTYLKRHTGQPVIASSLETHIHFLRLISPQEFNLTFQLVNPPTDLPSIIPDNALSDARALMRWHNTQP